ncbi:SDR family oxidoreductase [Glaciecola sp. 1036]|uniref:SDR family oxidoreductase n=1 Tax=Alteromonadaceae TaxID=72275 RepID=UPI003CFC2B6E
MSQRVVIIGANRGIGLEFARQYQGKGYTVVALCRKASQALKNVGCRIVEDVEVDNDGSMQQLADRIPLEQIDILIHNSGILESDQFPQIDMAKMLEHFNVNTLGPLRSILALKPLLNSGSKVGIVSSRVGSIEDNTSSDNYAYRVSKTAVNMVGKCLSIDLKEDGIAVALLHPGYVRTDMTNKNGLIDADESAAGLIERMDELSLQTTGIFVHTNGEQLPW